MTDRDIEEMLAGCAMAPEPQLKDKVLSDAAVVTPVAAPGKKRNLGFWKKFAVAFACLALVISAAVAGVGLYREEYMQVYFDVNPSVCVTVNRFDTVNGVQFINSDGEDCLDGVDITGKKLDEATETIVRVLGEKGYLADGELYISCYSAKNGDSAGCAQRMRECAEKVKNEKGYGCKINSDTVDSGDREHAAEHGISPTKYKMIENIISISDSYTIDGLKNKTMKELKEIYNSLGGDTHDR